MNKNAQELGRLGKGKPKRYTQAERRRRAQRCKTLVAARWRKAKADATEGETNETSLLRGLRPD